MSTRASLYRMAMLTYQLRESYGQRTHTEYKTTVELGEQRQTLEILTETVFDWAGITIPVNEAGAQLSGFIGQPVAEDGGTGSGRILWMTANEQGSSGKMGVQLDSSDDVFEGGYPGEIDGGDPFTISNIQNILIRNTGGVYDRAFSQLQSWFLPAGPYPSEAFYIDVRNATKVVLSHLGTSGLIRLCHNHVDLPVSPWIRAGGVYVLPCKQNYWKLVVEMTEADTPFSAIRTDKVVASSVIVTRKVPKPPSARTRARKRKRKVTAKTVKP